MPTDPTYPETHGSGSTVPQLPCNNLGGVVGSVYGTTCTNLNQAVQILYNPNATLGQRIGSGYYIGVVGGSHAALAFGLVWAAWEAIIPTSVACLENPECENTGINTVYHVVQEGKTIYVGITQNFAQRAAYWSNTNGWKPEPIDGLFENLSRFDARAVEQVLIEQYGLGNLANQINSIAATNPIFQSAIQRGNEILQMIGFFGQ